MNGRPSLGLRRSGGPSLPLSPIGPYCLAGPLPRLRPIPDLLTHQQQTVEVIRQPLEVNGRMESSVVFAKHVSFQRQPASLRLGHSLTQCHKVSVSLAHYLVQVLEPERI